MSGKVRAQRQTFAEIVAAVEAAPAAIPVEPKVTPGLFSGETLFDPDGNALREVDDQSLQPDDIRAAVLGGARLVWDACGCGGYCNALLWPEPQDLQKQATKSTPIFRKHDRARATRLTGDGGDVILVAGGVRWGDLFR